MTLSLLSLGGTLTLIIILFLIRIVIVRRRRNQSDPAWQSTGIKASFTAFDQAQGERARIAALKHEDSRRKLAALRSRPQGQTERGQVVEISRRAK